MDDAISSVSGGGGACQPAPRHTPSLPTTAQALDFYAHLQSDDGHWAGDYGGPFFLLPGLVMVCHITGVQLSAAHVDGMLTYMKNHQQEDGGWGLHMEGPSTMFGTVMQYVACRTLGMAAESVEMAAARAFIHKHGGATTAPSWCKFWLCVFGVYEWQGLNSIPPELWLLPRWSPFHPWRMWCHARMVYLPMSYLYGARAAAPEGPLQVALKKELYPVEYAAVDWDAARNTICPRDLYSPHTKIMDAAFEVLKYYERAPLQMLREPALRFAAQYCHEEDKQTNFVDIGPVNKVMNMLVAYHEFGRDSPEFSKHVARIWDYLWVAEDGVKMQGYNGSQLWDTGFAIQAMEATGMAERVSDTLARAYSFFDATQSKEDVPNREAFFRIISKGGWPFSTNDHGWPIADCTSEGLKGVMAIHRMGTAVARIPPARMFDAVNLVLEFQNPDGGWATYERNRGYNWFEWLNPAEVFGDIMIDYTYTELTSACVTALTQFQGQHPSHRTAEITAAIQRGVDFVRLQQRPDGSFYGSWGVCFTYGTWFGVEAMVAAGDPSGEDAPALAKACDFLVSKQNPDGGWGESYLSCVRKTYVSRESTAFNTAWALLGLIKAQTSHVEAVEAGVRFLMRLQRTSGDWPQQSVAGVFNRTCGITYTSYRNVFPIWALGAYRTEYHHKKDTTVPVPLAE